MLPIAENGQKPLFVTLNTEQKLTRRSGFIKSNGGKSDPPRLFVFSRPHFWIKACDPDCYLMSNLCTVKRVKLKVQKMVMKNLFIVLLGIFLLVSGLCFAEGNASNPLAKVKNTDIRAQYHDKPGGVFIPLLQHFLSYRGEDVNKTATRLIALQTLENAKWLKYDLIVPIDWENDNAIPASAEVQFGKMYNKQFGYYADLKAGLGSDRPFDWGVGIGARLVY